MEVEDTPPCVDAVILLLLSAALNVVECDSSFFSPDQRCANGAAR